MEIGLYSSGNWARKFLANIGEIKSAVFFKNKENILSLSESPLESNWFKYYLISENLKAKKVSLGLGKHVGGRLSTWSHCFLSEGWNITEQSSVRIGGSEICTPKRKVFNVDYHLCGCEAEVRDSRILLTYSVYVVL